MMDTYLRRVKIDDKFSKDGEAIYKTTEFEFNPGITCLVGCNGYGKTTLMDKMRERFNEKGIKYFKYYGLESADNLNYAVSLNSNKQIMQSWMNTIGISEGEKIKEYFDIFSQNLGYFVFNECKDAYEGWIFIDSVDSGFSIDNIRELKTFFIDTVLGTKPENLSLYIIISANAYELCRELDCIDARTGEHMIFYDYETYSDFIMRTRKLKDKKRKR